MSEPFVLQVIKDLKVETIPDYVQDIFHYNKKRPDYGIKCTLKHDLNESKVVFCIILTNEIHRAKIFYDDSIELVSENNLKIIHKTVDEDKMYNKMFYESIARSTRLERTPDKRKVKCKTYNDENIKKNTKKERVLSEDELFSKKEHEEYLRDLKEGDFMG